MVVTPIYETQKLSDRQEEQVIKPDFSPSPEVFFYECHKIILKNLHMVLSEVFQVFRNCWDNFLAVNFDRGGKCLA